MPRQRSVNCWYSFKRTRARTLPRTKVFYMTSLKLKRRDPARRLIIVIVNGDKRGTVGNNNNGSFGGKQKEEN